MPRYPFAFAALILFALMQWRCAREIFIELPDVPPQIVAISHFTDGRPFQVEVAISQDLFDAAAAEIPEVADVTISKGGQFLDKLRRAFSEDGKLYWESRDTAFTGIEYALSVRIAGYPVAEARSSIPAHAALRPIVVDPERMSVVALDDGRVAMRVPLILEVADMPDTDRFFAFNLQHETDVFQIVNGQPVVDYTYESGSFFLADGRTLSLLHNIPEPVVLINEKFWSNNRRTIFLDALIPFDPETERPRRIFIEWRTLSEAFYRYHLSLARQGENLPLSDPDAVFNNVQGGLGNFSGYAVSIDTVALPDP
jgi:hypothetical protein